MTPISFWIVSSAARAHRGRAKSGMAEGERGGAVEPAHERFYRSAVAIVETVHLGAVQGLDRRLGCETVERLVHVHDEEMDAVAPAACGGYQFVDVIQVELIALGGGNGFPQHCHPFEKRAAGFGIRRLERREHRREVARETGEQGADAGNDQASRSQHAGAGDEGIGIASFKTGGLPFHAEMPRFAVWRFRLQRRLLKKRQAELDPVIRSKRVADQRRKQNGRFTKPLGNRDLRRHGGLSLVFVCPTTRRPDQGVPPSPLLRIIRGPSSACPSL